MKTRRISPWAIVQATREVTCPYCLSAPGEACRTRTGKPLMTQTHNERIAAYTDEIGVTEFKRRHPRAKPRVMPPEHFDMPVQ